MGSQERNGRYILFFANSLINTYTWKVVLIFHEIVMQVDPEVMNYEIYSCIKCLDYCCRKF